MKKLNTTLGLVIIVLLSIIIVLLLFKQCRADKSDSHSHVIAYQIERMNKMIVAEQQYSDVYTYRSKKSLPGLEKFYSADKKITMLINAKAQATYDLSKMDLELDSVNRRIILRSIPTVHIELYPDVHFFDLDQSIFNKFEKGELNTVKQKGVEHIKKMVNETELKKQAHDQLLLNLSELYTIAHMHNWTLVDQTPYADELKAISNIAK
ncbi:DUF4230 domain-containing protein [Vaginella massiliensis]|uniref:DUF4230 domain-containing protein n=1 Tax=Vaginella massiliensis TaxID=1816680 RepID=UPI00083903B1|nr:DUF4230 domain-containing protein [Vaginella massiliensis]